jgi:hypothetical protein
MTRTRWIWRWLGTLYDEWRWDEVGGWISWAVERRCDTPLFICSCRQPRRQAFREGASPFCTGPVPPFRPKRIQRQLYYNSSFFFFIYLFPFLFFLFSFSHFLIVISETWDVRMRSGQPPRPEIAHIPFAHFRFVQSAAQRKLEHTAIQIHNTRCYRALSRWICLIVRVPSTRPYWHTHTHTHTTHPALGHTSSETRTKC